MHKALFDVQRSVRVHDKPVWTKTGDIILKFIDAVSIARRHLRNYVPDFYLRSRERLRGNFEKILKRQGVLSIFLAFDLPAIELDVDALRGVVETRILLFFSELFRLCFPQLALFCNRSIERA